MVECKVTNSCDLTTGHIVVTRTGPEECGIAGGAALTLAGEARAMKAQVTKKEKQERPG